MNQLAKKTAPEEELFRLDFDGHEVEVEITFWYDPGESECRTLGSPAIGPAFHPNYSIEGCWVDGVDIQVMLPEHHWIEMLENRRQSHNEP